MTIEGTTTVTYRPSRTIPGFREAIDESSRMAVWAFPFHAIADVAADKSHARLGRRLATPGVYVLGDGDSVYIGETGNVARRLLDHANDPSKSFAREVFVASAFSEGRFDKTAALYFQMKFRALASEAGHAHVLGAQPPTVHMSEPKRAPLDTMFETARRLVYDAGCRAFDSAVPPGRLPHACGPDGESGNGEGGDGADVGFFEIGVATAPLGSSEFELHYGSVWARAHTIGDVFVIAAGSDIRANVNASANGIFRKRHRLLRERGVLQTIPGVTDRLRLTEAIAVGSPAVGAKIVCGAHVNSGQWRPLRPGRQLDARA